MNPLLAEIRRFPILDQYAALKVTARKAYERSFYVFAKNAMGFKDLNWDTHGSTIQNLEADIPRHLVVMPRGTFKSSLGSVAWPIWLLIRNPNLRILIDSELYTNSKNFLREIKGHLMRPDFEELFGQFYNSGCWNEGEIIIKQRTEVRKEASITCSGIGAQKTGQHYDVIIGDDLNSPKNSHTPENRQKVIDHYRMYTSLLEPKGTIALIGTRYAENDCIGFVLATEVFPQEELTSHGLL